LVLLDKIGFTRWRIRRLFPLKKATPIVHFYPEPMRARMFPDGDPPHDGQDDRGADPPAVRDRPALPGARLTTLDLCGQAMMAVKIGVPLAVAFPGWAWLGPAATMLLILLLAMTHERWLVREGHGPVQSARQRTPATSGSAEAQEEPLRRMPVHGGGKSNENRLSGEAKAKPPQLGTGEMPPGQPLRRDQES
jgi:hypothetical protein